MTLLFISLCVKIDAIFCLCYQGPSGKTLIECSNHKLIILGLKDDEQNISPGEIFDILTQYSRIE